MGSDDHDTMTSREKKMCGRTHAQEPTSLRMVIVDIDFNFFWVGTNVFEATSSKYIISHLKTISLDPIDDEVIFIFSYVFLQEISRKSSFHFSDDDFIFLFLSCGVLEDRKSFREKMSFLQKKIS